MQYLQSRSNASRVEDAVSNHSTPLVVQVIRGSADKKKDVRSRDQRMFKGQFRY
jgi:hypothetical protein